ncbi:MAG: SDR family oxidoreductase [Candidatus Omnitrophica bacterium]|nr:SDR family oxidoreductase [Candidatus Omnitrophota bacterium]
MGILEKFSLKGKIAIVTGGAGLYGRCIVEGLAEAGAYVYIASRNVRNCNKLAEELKDKGYSVSGAELDQTDTESIIRLKDRVIAEQGKIDILVNNAVLRPMKGPDGPIEDFELSMKVNATGVVNITRIIAEEMKKKKSGVIINISSIYGVLGIDPYLYEGTDMGLWAPDYAFHRAGIINITRYYASLLGPYNIRVNCISPGGLFTNQHPKFVERYNRKTFLGRMANTEDIKGVVVFLASDASSYITGENIMMDGGLSAK